MLHREVSIRFDIHLSQVVCSIEDQQVESLEEGVLLDCMKLDLIQVSGSMMLVALLQHDVTHMRIFANLMVRNPLALAVVHTHVKG